MSINDTIASMIPSIPMTMDPVRKDVQPQQDRKQPILYFYFSLQIFNKQNNNTISELFIFFPYSTYFQ